MVCDEEFISVKFREENSILSIITTAPLHPVDVIAGIILVLTGVVTIFD